MTKSHTSLKSRQSRKNLPTKPQPKVSSNKEDKTGGLIYPGGDTAFKIILSARFCAAIWLHVSDCDETYNYWEPMHFLVFGKGLQTWEYSPQYALRSYTYLLFHASPLYLYHKLLQPNPILMFYFIRCVLGLMSALAEVFFYKAVCREFGLHIGRLSLAFQLLSAGMFISSTALLPSSFAMYTFTAACAAWWQQRYPLAIFFIALGSILGWPFAALLGVPIAYDMIIRRGQIKEFLFWSIVSGSAIVIPMIIADSFIYGRFTIAPFNIIIYNIFDGARPNLYGTEPFSFYFINGFINFNFIWFLALLSPFVILLGHYCLPLNNKCTYNNPYWLSISPLFLWLMVFMVQPHKEERFLFPIYPLICLCGAITIDIIQKLFFRIWNKLKNVQHGTHYLDITGFITISTIAIFGLISLSRIYALYHNYHAPLDILMDLNRFPNEGKISENTKVNVCIGKDWHRYPSSFFLPNNNWEIRFIKSEFKGLLPAPFSTQENATSIIQNHFNNRNLEEPKLYYNIENCHFLLDIATEEETDLEPNYSRMKEKWKISQSYKFLNAKKSNRFFRAFFVPYLNSKYVIYQDFNLLKSIKQQIK